MNFLISLIGAVSLTVQISFASAASASSTDLDPIAFYRQIKALRFDRTQVAEIEELVLRKERATIRLDIGEMHFAEPVAGVVSALVFLGQGNFRLKPPDRIEKEQVHRFTGEDSLDIKFSALYMRFNDETADTIKSQFNLQEKRPNREVVQLHERITKLFLEERHVNLHAAFTAALLNEPVAPFFFAVMECHEKSGSMPYYLIFSKDDNASEDISVYQFSPHAYDKAFYTLCSYSSNSDLKSVTSDSAEQYAGIYAGHYDMEIEIDGDKMAVRSDIILKSRIENIQAIHFILQEDMEVDSVHNAQGDTLQFVQEDDEAGVTIFFRQPIMPGERLLTIYYQGEGLVWSENSYILKNNIYWYPRRGYFIPATYDITYRFDRNKQLLSVGKLMDERLENKERISHWVENTAVPAFAFGIADFDSTGLHTGGSTAITVHSVDNRSASTRRRIGGDVASSFYFFKNILGTYPYDHLHVLETPSTTSNGFAGLLFLSAQSYEYEVSGINETLHAHEVSHQWWGNIVGWQSYHDQWLSEALAEYSGALVTQFLLKDDETFLSVIDGWRNDLLSGGHVGVSIGLKRFGYSTTDLSQSDGLRAGPIWLGHRLGQKHPVDYHLIVYEKGALIIHMLRLLLRDFETNSDDRFFALLRDFVSQYQNKKATTADFAAVVSKHAGRNMDRFFEQWIYGSEVPTVYYDYEIKWDRDRQYWIDIEVEQKFVTEPFEMEIPLSWKFEQKEEVRILEIDSWDYTIRFGPFDERPTNFDFNSYGGVLARVKRK